MAVYTRVPPKSPAQISGLPIFRADELKPPRLQVKRILIQQRENPIVNRLNKTKVEKKPDLKQEKEDRLKELRQRDQAAQQLRVCPLPLLPRSISLLCCLRYFAVSSGRKADPELQQKEEARQAQEWKEKKYQKDHAYDDIFTEENMAASSNQDRDEDWEEDFM